MYDSPEHSALKGFCSTLYISSTWLILFHLPYLVPQENAGWTELKMGKEFKEAKSNYDKALPFIFRDGKKRYIVRVSARN